MTLSGYLWYSYNNVDFFIIGHQPQESGYAVLLDRDGDLSRLAAAIRETADDLEAGIDHAAAQVLLKALGAHGDADFDVRDQEVEPRCLTDDSEYDLPLDDLRRELATFTAGDEVFVERPDTEDLFIYLNVLGKGSDAYGRTRALSEVTRIVGSRPAPEKDTDLHEAVRSLLAAENLAAVDPVVERLAAMVRERGIKAVATFWEHVCADNPPGLPAAVWPHLVGEYLADTAEGRDNLHLLQTFVTSREALAAPDIASRLQRLAIYREERSGCEFLGRPERRYFPVYAELLKTSRGKVFGGWLQEGLQRSGPDRQMRTIATALGPYRGKQRMAYAEWLKSSVVHAAAPPTKVLDDLRRRINDLEPGERSAPWLAEALEIVGRHSPASGRHLLQRIVGERRLFLFKAWPPDARAAAERALDAAEAAQYERGEED